MSAVMTQTGMYERCNDADRHVYERCNDADRHV